ncbi:MAG: type III secretion system export apparatus subunit SctV [Myxococcota bacterium]|nr:type III secretion system export apparatus subunit SctV [Myxococcota bacterium]
MQAILQAIRSGALITNINRFADLALAGLIVGIVGMLVLPLPTFILDLLLTLSITIALTMLLVAVYMPNALKLSSFPTILLVTTLFRLALNVSSTRLILLDADAGEVIAAFGNFVVAGNFVVGAVIFLILTLIQFLVIAKGSERVAEVAARFTLDAMPGKQMSIDADLRAGAFDMDEARKRRNELSRESQLFGAMDGAMKFVKGDAIAGIIITIVNIIAGIIVGMTQKDMTAGEAVEVYSLLTIGDGLVSQIPALLISMTAGIVVTRVASEVEGRNLAEDIAAQLLNNFKAFYIAATFLFVMAIVPGLPTVPFMILAVFMAVIGYSLKSMNEPQLQTVGEGGEAKDELAEETRKIEAQSGRSDEMLQAVTPIVLEVAPDLVGFVDDSEQGQVFLGEYIPMMRDGLFYELGVRFPGVRVRAGQLPENQYEIQVNEVPVARGSIEPGRVLANEVVDRMRLLGVEARIAENPATSNEACWIREEDRALAESAGITCWDVAGYIVLHMSAVLRRNAPDFLGIQEVQEMLDQVEKFYPALVKETIPKSVSLFQLTDITRRLVEEGISIRDLRSILQTLAEWGPVESDNVALTEQVRSSLRRAISHHAARGSDTLVVYLLDNEIEETVRSSIQHSASGSFLALEPEITQEILAALRKELGQRGPTSQRPVLLTAQDIRRFVRKLVELEFPEIGVLSFQELSPDLNVQPLGRIGLL